MEVVEGAPQVATVDQTDGKHGKIGCCVIHLEAHVPSNPTSRVSMRQNFAPDLSLAWAQGEEDAAHCQYFTAWRASCRSAQLTILLSLGPFFVSSLSFFLTYEILKSVGPPGSLKHVASHKIKTCQTLFPLFSLCCLKKQFPWYTDTMCVRYKPTMSSLDFILKPAPAKEGFICLSFSYREDPKMPNVLKPPHQNHVGPCV